MFQSFETCERHYLVQQVWKGPAENGSGNASRKCHWIKGRYEVNCNVAQSRPRNTNNLGWQCWCKLPERSGSAFGKHFQIMNATQLFVSQKTDKWPHGDLQILARAERLYKQFATFTCAVCDGKQTVAMTGPLPSCWQCHLVASVRNVMGPTPSHRQCWYWGRILLDKIPNSGFLSYLMRTCAIS